MKQPGPHSSPPRIAAGFSGAGVAVFLALVSLATAAAAPRPEVVALAAEGLLAASTLAAASAWLIGRAASRAIAASTAAADAAYRSRRTRMSHAERVAAVEAITGLASASATAARIGALWGVAAATGGLAALYAAVLGYRLLWDCARREEEQPGPGPAAAYALLVASLGLAAPLVARWAATLASRCAEPRWGRGPASTASLGAGGSSPREEAHTEGAAER